MSEGSRPASSLTHSQCPKNNKDSEDTRTKSDRPDDNDDEGKDGGGETISREIRSNTKSESIRRSLRSSDMDFSQFIHDNCFSKP